MPSPDSAGRRRAPRVALLVAAGVLIMTVGVVGAVAAVAASAPRASVDGVEFTADELTAATQRAERSGAPRAESLGAAVDVLRDDLALFAVARDVGASDVTRPDDITGVLDRVNRDRATSAKAGEVLYGPVEYDEKSFYGKALTDIRQAVLARLDDGAAGTTVSDADVRALFDADPSAWSDAATTYSVSEVEGSGVPPAGADWSALAAQGVVEQRVITAEDLDSGSLGPDLTAALRSASDGDVVGPMPTGSGFRALRVDSRSVDQEQAFEHYHSRIRAVLLEQRLDALVSQARSAQDVRLP